jgi:tetratricopeptide (TPR) repeat protein
MDSKAVNPPPQRRLRRRWRVPPAIMHGPEPLECAGVLDELSGAAGLVLWQSLRDVTLWAGTPPAEREGLFSACAERKRIASLLTTSLNPELEQPLGMITAMVGRPGRVSAERVALACRRVAQWAEKHGKLATSLAFAQAAALVCPGDASSAFKVGQIARRRAEYVRAETWFRRAIALARQEADWASYALAFVGLGNLYLQKGNFPSARRLHTRGLRAARRHSLREIQGRALHDLFVICGSTNEKAAAQEYAREALAAYGPTHPAVPVLAQDVAYFWLLQGYFAPALRVFTSLRRHVGESVNWIVLVPNLARAAGGANDRVLFEQAWEEVWSGIEGCAPAEGHAEACLELARGAASLKEWDRAEEAASRARALASARKEFRIEFEAEAVLASVQSERYMLHSIDVATVEFVDANVFSLADDIVHSLQEAAAVA